MYIYIFEWGVDMEMWNEKTMAGSMANIFADTGNALRN